MHAHDPRGSEALQDLHEATLKEGGVEVSGARIDTQRRQTEQFRRRGHRQQMIEADGQQNIGRQLQVPSPDEESLAAHG